MLHSIRKIHIIIFENHSSHYLIRVCLFLWTIINTERKKNYTPGVQLREDVDPISEAACHRRLWKKFSY